MCIRDRDGASPYHFIEVMGCPGGCINGGGQPRCSEEGYREKRSRALYSEDERKVLRKSHENPDLMKLYAEFLGDPNGHKAHDLLHTHYAVSYTHLIRLGISWILSVMNPAANVSPAVTAPAACWSCLLYTSRCV